MVGIQISVSKVLLLCAAVVWAGVSRGEDRLHSGRITKSFTEPIEQSVAASAEVGIIVQSDIKEGDRVRVGDTLAKINQSVLQQSLAIARARAESTAKLEAAKSQLELAKSQRDAVQSLVDGGHTNKFEVEQRQSEYQKAYSEFRLALDEAKLNRLEVKRISAQIDDRTISSPINGVVTEIHKQLGENVSSNEPQYATIVRIDELKVRFYLDAKTLLNSKVGGQVEILVSEQRSPTRAEITYISPIIDPDSGLGRMDIKVDNRDQQIQSGVICFWNPNNDVPMQGERQAKRSKTSTR